MTTTREERAANRRRRRGTDDEPAESHESPSHLQDALRAAASAAAVGAAVGAARAYSARQHEQEEQEEHEATRSEPDDVVLEDEDEAPEEEHEPEPAAGGSAREAVDAARRALRDLRGVDAESVSFVARHGSGWTVGLVVLELRRIPDSTDILATYEVELDRDGEVARFEQARRYHRSEADRGGRE